MRIVFMGTPKFSVPSLEALAARHDVALVVTRPDAVRGRGRALEPSAVKARALELGLDVLEASRMDERALAAVRAAEPDVICVVAFGCILPDELLSVAPLGAVNVHASLLPRWRGAAPIQRAILAGDERAGVSIMRVAHDLDAGAWCAQASVEVGEKDADELTVELSGLGASELVGALDALADGTAVWHEQDASRVTLAPKLTKAEMRLSPEDSAVACARRVRASGDTAPARLALSGRGLRVLEARVADEFVEAGAVTAAHGRVLLGCAEGTLEPLRVRPDGKGDRDASSWAAGLRGELSWERV